METLCPVVQGEAPAVQLQQDKELVVDLRHAEQAHTAVSIQGEPMEVMQFNRWLEVHMNNRL